MQNPRLIAIDSDLHELQDSDVIDPFRSADSVGRLCRE
jgi:hypothetical protein